MVKKVKKFNYKTDLKKQWKKEKEKKNPVVKTDQLKSYWDPKKSMKQNYANLGLSLDPNETFAIPRAKQLLNPEVMSLEEAKSLGPDYKETMAVKMLVEQSKQKAENKYKLNEDDVLFCIYMLEKYNDNFEKMARDYRNHYQETASQIKKKISIFKSMKTRYEQYLNDKKMGVTFLGNND